MVSSSHEAMHHIYQEDPGVFARTFRTLDLPFPDPVAVSLMPTDLTELRPTERRVDTLLKIDTASGDSHLLIVEAQGKKDQRKPSSWAYYVAHLQEKYGVPPVLLVMCQDLGTAAWAAKPFTVGPPQWPTLTLRPLVLGPHNVPIITDPSAAARDIPLATLSAITHAKNPNAPAILKALAVALKTVDEETARIFAELTELGLGDVLAAETWRQLMSVDLSFFRSETSQRLRAESRAEDILLILDTRGVEVPESVRDRITTCTDLDELRVWLTRALTVDSVDDLFTEAETEAEA
ncbi:hypothetical protein BN159_3848 [Streptomyces davaonensis JCM 4913]|uniref:Transposase (putative) YhgA-like domain-containing protein n=1 Tax=Streptomyces davaonensis (strain DSM 101723 / JCM 4913 / KCC S-0913 / 768) TaxID=1214101 RepID=K4R520_STRDJ|nr:hypothetical protein [Streptomyces davaonensis]CCK28227.1 hypothetical protein BN159_3848 [Streptomyces davaonensis JCM 4913]